ncbi:hypothetical protein BC936DRAFT_139964 [Jimgerdemannia flammicorona]|uniref:Uncharacterized protein n=2 Tax=Jimgerdemannia flammicorona TaxID=994334 RepID=A0A433DHA8_9FUNG|nr:hypothetical protein BC936DRAFT_139964 [Jimgerdemannia flammicorona]RUS35072.1 hypothetical protein BC938DRAFT_476200 [Jimgerdemannia flammicorona]
MSTTPNTCLMSILIIALASSNKNAANSLHSSVFPTPVGPKNMKLPNGLFGFCNPARDSLMAFAIDCNA